MVKEGSFRQDLYYRIAGYKVAIPPLRDRRDDIPAIAQLILSHLTKETGVVYRLTQDALAKLLEYAYPGNIRELRSVLVKASARCKHGVINPDDIDFEHVPGCVCTQEFPSTENPSVESSVERRYGRRSTDRPDGSAGSGSVSVLARRAGDAGQSDQDDTDLRLDRHEEQSIRNLIRQYGTRRIVAEKLGISERTLYRKLKKYGLDTLTHASVVVCAAETMQLMSATAILIE
jgi:DNA-binding NtrC family response regulator